MWLNRFEVKTLGCILILLSSMWFGTIRVKRLRRKPRALRDLADALSVVVRISCSQMAPLPEAFAAASDSSVETSDFFKLLHLGLEVNVSLSELWTKSVKTLRFLNAQERQTLVALKNTLGCADVRMQRAELEDCILYLRKHAEDSLLAAASGTRLTFGLSAVCGLMLAILLY